MYIKVYDIRETADGGIHSQSGTMLSCMGLLPASPEQRMPPPELVARLQKFCDDQPTRRRYIDIDIDIDNIYAYTCICIYTYLYIYIYIIYIFTYTYTYTHIHICGQRLTLHAPNDYLGTSSCGPYYCNPTDCATCSFAVCASRAVQATLPHLTWWICSVSFERLCSLNTARRSFAVADGTEQPAGIAAHRLLRCVRQCSRHDSLP